MNTRFVRFCIHASANRQGKNPSTQGLTLIELITSLVIISILSAIALPSFLNLSLRSRHAEAQVNVASILRAQQAHYTWKNEFARNLDDLQLHISDSQFYAYRTNTFTDHQTLSGERVDGIVAIAVPQAEVRGYMGKSWVEVSAGTPAVVTILCEGNIGESYFMNHRTYCR
ncbi:MAG: type IV pilin-like G/H family protein [Cyanobacteria bacterium P01_E01_bin.6]